MDTDSATVPVKPFRAVTVIVDMPDAPARISLGVTAPADMENSGAGAGGVTSMLKEPGLSE